MVINLGTCPFVARTEEDINRAAAWAQREAEREFKMATIGKAEVKLVWRNSLAGEAFGRIVDRIRVAREMHDTVRPSELWDDLQTAVEGIGVQTPLSDFRITNEGPGDISWNLTTAELKLRTEEAGPYRFTVQIGDYSESHSFKTEQEMRRFEQKQKDGLWYDWNSGESNDPEWGDLANGARLTDKSTGEEVTRIIFYHAGTHYLERVAVKNGNATVASPPGYWSPGDVALIIETRELEFRRKEDS